MPITTGKHKPRFKGRLQRRVINSNKKNKHLLLSIKETKPNKAVTEKTHLIKDCISNYSDFEINPSQRRSLDKN